MADALVLVPEMGKKIRVRGKRGWLAPKQVTGRLVAGVVEITVGDQTVSASSARVYVRDLGWREVHTDEKGPYVLATQEGA